MAEQTVGSTRAFVLAKGFTQVGNHSALIRICEITSNVASRKKGSRSASVSTSASRSWRPSARACKPGRAPDTGLRNPRRTASRTAVGQYAWGRASLFHRRDPLDRRGGVPGRKPGNLAQRSQFAYRIAFLHQQTRLRVGKRIVQD